MKPGTIINTSLIPQKEPKGLSRTAACTPPYTRGGFYPPTTTALLFIIYFAYQLFQLVFQIIIDTQDLLSELGYPARQMIDLTKFDTRGFGPDNGKHTLEDLLLHFLRKTISVVPKKDMPPYVYALHLAHCSLNRFPFGPKIRKHRIL
jgi:hypothetical protein